MAAVIATPRPEVKDSAPLVEQMHVPVDLIGRLLGQGGSAIRRIQAVTGAHVQVADCAGALEFLHSERITSNLSGRSQHPTKPLVEEVFPSFLCTHRARRWLLPKTSFAQPLMSTGA
jgi:polyribonucleotide nucleotidyltransferase